MMKAKDLMNTNLHYCTPLDNVYEAALLMKEHDIGAVPIVENGNIVGMVTDRDLVVRGIAEKHPNSNKITNLMTKNIITTTPETSIDEIASTMATHQIRRIPVVENNQLVGMLALGDLARHNHADDRAGAALNFISADSSSHEGYIH